MEFPSPSFSEYGKSTLVALLIFAVLQYTGVFFDNPGEFDFAFLISVGILIPLFIYGISFVTANTGWLPDWDEKNQTRSR